MFYSFVWCFFFPLLLSKSFFFRVLNFLLVGFLIEALPLLGLFILSFYIGSYPVKIFYLLLGIVHGRWSAFVFGKKIKARRGKHGGEKKSDCFYPWLIKRWNKYGGDKYVHNLYNFDQVNFLSNVFFFFFFFFDLIDNSNSAKIGTLLSSCWLVYCLLLFFNEKWATLCCLKFFLWFYISKSDLPIGSHSILYLIDLIFSPVLIGSCDWFNIIIEWIGELNLYLAVVGFEINSFYFVK